MTTSTQWYLDSIERELADLPSDERAELLEDLAAHFTEFDSDEDLVAALGDPATYARELRDAAGLSATPALESHVSLIDRARANFDALRRSAGWRSVAAFLPELRPAWWVLRAWLIVGAIAEGPPGSGGVDFPIPRVADNTLVGLVALMLVIPVSVFLGRRALLGQGKGLNVALTLFGALFCLVLPASANEGSNGSSTFPFIASTIRQGATTVAARGDVTPNDMWGYDSAGNAFLVSRITPTPNGPSVSRAIVELHALCPIDLLRGPARALRTVDGAPIVCVGERAPIPTLGSATASTAPPTTTSATTTTVAPATTVAPTTAAPTTTIVEATR